LQLIPDYMIPGSDRGGLITANN